MTIGRFITRQTLFLYEGAGWLFTWREGLLWFLGYCSLLLFMDWHVKLCPVSDRLRCFAAFLVATIPQVLFISSVVSNDIPVAALSTVTLWMLAGLMRKGSSGCIGRRCWCGLWFDCFVKGQRIGVGCTHCCGFALDGFVENGSRGARVIRIRGSDGSRHCSYSRMVVYSVLDFVWIATGFRNA